MKVMVRTVGVALLMWLTQAAIGATWYVDGAVGGSGDGRSWATAFKTIQEGIDGATDGDTVVVGPGTYVENIRFEGKNIVLRSTNPSDPEVVRDTIIDGAGVDSVVSFSGTEKASCVLAGFTIQNGRADYGGGVRGGTQDTQTLATIRNNFITGNRADGG